MNKRTIQVPATLDSVNRKKDRTVSFRFTSLYEVTNEDFAVMDTFHQSAGHLLFAETPFTEADIPDEDVEYDTEKPMSVQIRDALWILYKVEGGKPEDKDAWNVFYRKHTKAYKTKILDRVHMIEEQGGLEAI